MLFGGYQSKQKRPEDMPVVSVPTMPDTYLNKALDKGIGLPPIKEPYISTANYGAKCMLIGYKAGKKTTKKRYKKKIKLLNQIEAIKLIEQQPSEDCVSRKFMYELGATCIATRDKNGKLIALGAIENLPPVTPTFPKGITNGDMIKAMFPDIKIHEHEKTDICDAYIQIDIWDFSICVSKDWWDAPYKRGDSDGSN